MAPSAAEEDRALVYSGYWDDHYSKSEGEEPTHEWFRSFVDLQPFLQTHLFESQGLKPQDNPLILHIGSGDSVSYSAAWPGPSSPFPLAPCPESDPSTLLLGYPR